jgi:50S ribosomal protein L16 3-hydroxylase
VFLLQGSGQRQWSVGDACDHNTAKLEHPDLQLLADFHARDQWVLNPGDMLYLPPGIAHWGIALQECVTYSIGFRAPTFSEAISSLADHLFENEANSKVFRDQLASVRSHPAELTSSDIDTYRAWLTEQLADTALLTRWFGREATRSKYRNCDAIDDLDTSPVINWATDLQQTTLQRSFESRLAWMKVADSDNAQLFADGNEWLTSQALAHGLCEYKQVTGKQLAECCRDSNDQLVVAQLLALGVLLP